LDVVGAVTAGAAGLAAVLAGINLYVSGKRELNRWTRETLVEILVLFLDASFKHSSACRAILGESPLQPELNRLRSAILAAHDAENEALTRLRLLAPPQVVREARALLEAEYLLAEPCFLDQVPVDESDELIIPVRKSRRQFIESARSVLNLRETKGTGDFDRNVSWRKLRIMLKEASGQQE
jgi:hypothetical protein